MSAFVPVAYQNGVVDIEVKTLDTWTLEPGASASRAGGVNKSGWFLRDTNALGTGVLIGASRTSDADRSGTEYKISHPKRFRRLDLDRPHTLPAERRSDQRNVDRPAVLRHGHALGGRVFGLHGHSHRLRLQRRREGRPSFATGRSGRRHSEAGPLAWWTLDTPAIPRASAT